MAGEPHILRYTRWLREARGLAFDATTHAGYDALWRWSCADLGAFWQTIFDYFEVRSPTPHAAVLAEATMPGARWFPGARVNYARHVFSHAAAADAAGVPAIVFRNEALQQLGTSEEIGWLELRRQVASLAAALRGFGVEPGDRVGAFLPNVPQAAVAFLACASVGAVWSVCSPDIGPMAVLDRFRQIEPKVLVACDGYVYGGIHHDRSAVVAELLAGLPSVRDVVLWRNLDAGAAAGGLAGEHRRGHDYAALIADDEAEARAARPAVRSPALDRLLERHHRPAEADRGTATAGVMLEALKSGALHNDVGPSAIFGDRYFWLSSTGWIMWNSQMGALLGGTTVCMFDGSPAGPQSGLPGAGRVADWSTLWRFAAETGVTFFGAGAAFYASCMKAGVEPQAAGDLSALRAVGSTGSPLATDAYEWIWASLPRPGGEPIWLNSISGGTDFAGAFVAGLRTLPVVAGEMQCRYLGAAVEAYGEPDGEGRGQALIDAVGELVCTQPMPSMPLYLWGDQPPGPQGRRYHDSYFDMYPGIWRHGDWIRITPRGGAVIYGRSDATINRHGIRMGTAELYRAVEAFPEVLDSLVVDLEYLGRESYMPLFVVLRERRGPRCRPGQAHEGIDQDRALGPPCPPTTSGRWRRCRARSRARRWSCRSRSCCSARRPRKSSSRARWPMPARLPGSSISRRGAPRLRPSGWATSAAAR